MNPSRLARWFTEPEIIGDAACPLIKRWTLLGDRTQGVYRWPFKLMVHYFVPGTADPHPHDHPRSFVTCVVWGRYVDIRRDGSQQIMRPGMVRYRQAEHAHRTIAGDRGCWTVVVMGPQRREWGFWFDGVWMPFRTYIAQHGGSQRCP